MKRGTLQLALVAFWSIASPSIAAQPPQVGDRLQDFTFTGRTLSSLLADGFEVKAVTPSVYSRMNADASVVPGQSYYLQKGGMLFRCDEWIPKPPDVGCWQLTATEDVSTADLQPNFLYGRWKVDAASGSPVTEMEFARSLLTVDLNGTPKQIHVSYKVEGKAILVTNTEEPERKPLIATVVDKDTITVDPRMEDGKTFSFKREP